MTNYHDVDHARIARTTLAAWKAHEQALDDTALTYIDHLIDEITAPRPLCPADLRAKLRMLIPGMTLTTARRMINLKYGNPAETEILGPTMN